MDLESEAAFGLVGQSYRASRPRRRCREINCSPCAARNHTEVREDLYHRLVLLTAKVELLSAGLIPDVEVSNWYCLHWISCHVTTNLLLQKEAHFSCLTWRRGSADIESHPSIRGLVSVHDVPDIYALRTQCFGEISVRHDGCLDVLNESWSPLRN
jgi:hypothetical protein